MTVFTAIAIYFIIWWLTLFAVLPFGVRSQAESGKVVRGTDPGAPVKPRLAIKLIVNSVIAGIIFGLLWFVGAYLGIGLGDLPSIFPQDRQ